MFFNTSGFFGTQYDVKARISPEGSVQIINMSTSAQVDNYDAGFTAYTPDTYTGFDTINKSAEASLQSELTNYRKNPNLDTKVFDTVNISSKYDANMKKFMSTEPQTKFVNSTPGASTFVPGPSPVRMGVIVAPGADVFNSM